MHDLPALAYGVNPVQPEGYYDEERLVDLMSSLMGEILALRDDLVETNSRISFVKWDLDNRIKAFEGIDALVP